LIYPSIKTTAQRIDGFDGINLKGPAAMLRSTGNGGAASRACAAFPKALKAVAASGVSSGVKKGELDCVQGYRLAKAEM